MTVRVIMYDKTNLINFNNLQSCQTLVCLSKTRIKHFYLKRLKELLKQVSFVSFKLYVFHDTFNASKCQRNYFSLQPPRAIYI